MRKGGVKDFIAYIEDGKTKAMEINRNSIQLSLLCEELGLTVLGFGAFKNERDAVFHADTVWRKK